MTFKVDGSRKSEAGSIRILIYPFNLSISICGFIFFCFFHHSDQSYKYCLQVLTTPDSRLLASSLFKHKFSSTKFAF